MTPEIAVSPNNPLKKLRNTYKKKIETYIQVVEQRADKLSNRDRAKVETMIIMEEHNRDVIDKLFSNKGINETHFEWLSQLRYVREADGGSESMIITCDQLNFSREYGYEYQGNNGRLVITALTDKAYMTLTNALHMFKGGAPQGPAGTGKTETTKDLGKNLATFVIIQNCSDQMDHNSLGTNFCGLAMEGVWGCFDEFNRITLDVLSVITTMIKDILDSLFKKGQSAVCIGDAPAFLAKPNTGLFITMNPGYAGRTQLPDNLASLFRPVAMMVPDFFAIAKNILMSKGFQKNEELAKKIVTVYDLMQRQLSRQDFYDFSTRAVKSCVLACGNIKKKEPNQDEVKIVLKAIRDMNLPKLVFEDVSLFDNLFMDLFPEIDEPEIDNDALQISIEQCMIARGLQLDENIVVKAMQLKECKDTRHGNMLIGSTMSGKTTCWSLLAEALNRIYKEEKEEKGGDAKLENMPVKYECINPKSINVDELYGSFDNQSPPQWKEGVLSNVLKQMVSAEQNISRWMIIDGPVDTLWIESMNSVLDDSKRLTLVNCDVIALTKNVRLLFEVDGLAVASPATVSRVGMVYLDIEELGWKPIVRSWLETKKEEGAEFKEFLSETVFRYLDKVITTKALNCKELVKTTQSACVKNMCNLYDSLQDQFMDRKKDMVKEDFFAYCEKWFVFSLIWSIGATVDEQSRRELDIVIRDIEPMFPTTNTVFDYYINVKKGDWAPWEEQLKSQLLLGKEFHDIYIQTVDWARNRFISQALLSKQGHILFVGNSGVGKTVLIEKTLLAELNQLELSFTINFSAGTSSNRTQEVIQSNFDRRANNKYKPKNTKLKAVCFIDDLNMPKKDTYGSQPPLELIRQWFENGFWYDREKVVKNFIEHLQIIAAMGKPGGGRAEITPRIVSKFHLINFTNPNEKQMKKIYQTIYNTKFQQFGDDIKFLEESLAAATITIFNQCMSDFLPTPKKTHYIYNMRDISKVFQGLFLADKVYYESKEQVIKLWGHEVLRVFHDRLINQIDRDKFVSMVNGQLDTHFQMNYVDHCMTNQEKDALFVDFMSSDEEMKVYEEVIDFPRLRDYLNEKLDEYNKQKKITIMDIVLFTDAIIHISRIYRVINLKRGHALLVGVGGSGRHSLTRLSAYISNMNVDQLEIRKDFTLKDFRFKLCELYELAAYKGVRAGKEKLKTVFIFSDNDVIDEAFLEDIQNMLNAGIVPNIYPPEELSRVRDEMKIVYKQHCQKTGQPFIEQPDVMNEFFYNRVKDNMHLSICMSPIGERFRNYTRNFPALINNTAIDWFMAWPEEALIEVAKKYIERIDIDEQFKTPLALQCAYSFKEATSFATKMEERLRRIFYVTPTNFIELLKGYEKILKTKRKDIGTQATKLRNGLGRLASASQQVAEMTLESETKRAEVSKKSQECQDLKIDLAKQEKAAQEAQKQIEVKTESVGNEKKKAIALADDANADLARTMPILEAANEAVGNLTKKDIGEVKAYANPPKDIMNVMSAVMTVLGKHNADWNMVKKEMADPKFMDRIITLDKDNMSEATMKKIEAYTKKNDFLPAILTQKSLVAGALCSWVRAVEEYHKALKIVRPKLAKKEAAEALLAQLEAQLKAMQDEFNILDAKLKQLKELLKKNTDEMEAYKADLEQLQAKIERGDKLITGLADEKDRWEKSLINLDEQIYNLVGDSIISAAFMSLCGPFPADYRDDMNALWLKKIGQLEIPHNKNFNFCDFLGTKATTKKWQMDGLPIDMFSSENGVLITKGDRWGLNIDPQTQANNWIKKTHGKNLIILDVNDNKLIQKMTKCITSGKTVLLQDVMETLDPSLDNILNKSFLKGVGSELQVKIGDDLVVYNPKFMLYITTRMSNPHYTPEISTKVNVVNFSIKEQGLEEQCLGIVVQEEQPTLEQNKNQLVDKIEKGQNELKALEDDILSKLQESKVSLLENVSLIQALQTAKETQENVASGLESSHNSMKKINETRDQFRQCGKIASGLFFVLLELHKINPMYQFSLEWYRSIFKLSINDAKQNSGQQDKIQTIIKTHIRNVYLFTCRSLFECHKLLLAFQLCIKMKESEGVIDPQEYLFFLKGASGNINKENAISKPNVDWIQDSAWNHLQELDQNLPNFANICQAINLSTKEWKNWFSSKKPEPEDAQLPGEWETKCEEPLRKMIILRCFRPDRVNFAIKNYISTSLKSNDFITSKSTMISDIFKDSSPGTPIIIILTQGTDPTETIYQFAKAQGVEVDSISLGKGQSQKALKFLQKGADDGNWCFLSNCHLSTGMLPDLEAKLDEIMVNGNYKDSFRLIMSASPTDSFPISLLQRSVKMTIEPPRGIKANMTRLYRTIGPSFTQCDKESAFRKAIFGLCWFHTLLIERKKFKSLGWNENYPFNDSDWKVCADTLANYMGRIKEDLQPIDSYNRKAAIPWQAIQYLIAKANYGGRVTDDRDIRLIDVYANEIFNEDLVLPEKWRPGTDIDPKYQYPADEQNVKNPVDQAAVFTPDYFLNTIGELFPIDDLPEAYGQHTNAEINSQTIDSLELLEAILSLQPANSKGGGENTEARVLKEIELLRSAIPEEIINIQMLKHKLQRDGDPLNIVLVQEVSRYNNLVEIIRKTLNQLELGIMGLDLISPDLEKMMVQCQENKVPDKWAFAYFSTKPLSNWKEDLKKRYDFFLKWTKEGTPACFWISAFTFPTGFTTSLLQRFSRKKDSPPIDRLEFDFIPITKKVPELVEGPKDGAYIYGLFLEGAKWDEEKGNLCEPEVMELYVPMPVIHFKPISKRTKQLQNVYECPCYYYPIRKGTVERDSYMMKIDLKLGESSADHWIKRGTAVLMSIGS